MTPKEKAKELVENFKFETKQSEIINDIILGDVSVIFQHHKAKQCALIAVDIVLSAIPNECLECWKGESQMVLNEDVYYWQKVKQEIEKI